MAVPYEWSEGLRNLSGLMSVKDAERSFDRCSVGGESCKQPSIKAHCIPRTALNLIANEKKTVIGVDAEPPRTPGHWIESVPLGERSIRNFNVGQWACAEHDRQFSSVDSTCIDVQDDLNLFLMVYRTTTYLTQKAIRAASRLAIPMLDPAEDTPEGFLEPIRENLEEMARNMSLMAIRTLYLKWSTDKLLNRKAYDEIEYRVSMWETVPTMAATGMRWVEGPGNGVEWYGENSIIPVWLILLPQEYGQTIITASPKGIGAYLDNIHEGMRKGNRAVVKMDNNWTHLMCRKVLTNAAVVAISHDRFFQTTYAERDNLQTYLSARTLPEMSKLKLPNLLNIR